MKKLSLNREGTLQILGFTDYQEYKPYKARAAASPEKVVYMGEPARAKAIVFRQWVSLEKNMLGVGSDNYYNYKAGKGHGLSTPQECFQSALAALGCPAFIIVFRS